MSRSTHPSSYRADSVIERALARTRRTLAETREVLDEHVGDRNPHDTMKWRGEWDFRNTPYFKSDVTRDGEWLMIANRDTSERPAPSTLEPPRWLLDPTPAWVSSSVSATEVRTGQRYTFVQDVVSLRLRAYIPSALLNFEYRVQVKDLATGSIQDYEVPNPGQVGWVDVDAGARLIPAGSQFDVALVVTDPTGAVVFAGDWNYSSGNGAITPELGAAYERLNQATLRFNYTDAFGGDRTAELQGVVVGSDIVVLNRTYEVVGVTIAGTYVEYDIVASGASIPAAQQTFNFTVPVSLPLPFVEAPGQWTGWLDNPGAQGIISVDGSPITADDTGYGVDIEVQNAYVSRDWDLMAYSGGL